jgi:hypothetical protein
VRPGQGHVATAWAYRAAPGVRGVGPVTRLDLGVGVGVVVRAGELVRGQRDGRPLLLLGDIPELERRGFGEGENGDHVVGDEVEAEHGTGEEGKRGSGGSKWSIG